jgi:hypothetical protein
MTGLSDAAITHIYEFYQKTDDPVMKNDLRRGDQGRLFSREFMLGGLYKEDFRDINLQSYGPTDREMI